MMRLQLNRVLPAAVAIVLACCLPMSGQKHDESPKPDDWQNFGVFTGEPLGSVEIIVLGDTVSGLTPDGVRLSGTLTDGNPWPASWPPYPVKIEGTISGPTDPELLADCPNFGKTTTVKFEGAFVSRWKIEGTYSDYCHERDKNGKLKCVRSGKVIEHSFTLTNPDEFKEMLEGMNKRFKRWIDSVSDKADEAADTIENSREVRRPADRIDDPFDEQAEDTWKFYHDDE